MTWGDASNAALVIRVMRVMIFMIVPFGKYLLVGKSVSEIRYGFGKLLGGDCLDILTQSAPEHPYFRLHIPILIFLIFVLENGAGFVIPAFVIN